MAFWSPSVRRGGLNFRTSMQGTCRAAGCTYSPAMPRVPVLRVHCLLYTRSTTTGPDHSLDTWDVARKKCAWRRRARPSQRPASLAPPAPRDASAAQTEQLRRQRRLQPSCGVLADVTPAASVRMRHAQVFQSHYKARCCPRATHLGFLYPAGTHIAARQPITRLSELVRTALPLIVLDALPEVIFSAPELFLAPHLDHEAGYFFCAPLCALCTTHQTDDFDLWLCD